MNANEARQLTEQYQKQNKEFNEYIKYTEDEIKNSIKNGRRHAVMFHTYSLKHELKQYWERKGYQIKRLFPPQETLYVVW